MVEEERAARVEPCDAGHLLVGELTCAADLPYAAPTSLRTGFAKMSICPSANGPQDSICTPCSRMTA